MEHGQGYDHFVTGSILQSRNPWVKLVAMYAVAVPLAAAVGYIIGGRAFATEAALTALALGLLTGLVVWLRLRGATHQAR